MEPITSKVSMDDHRRRRCGARHGGPARSAGSIAASSVGGKEMDALVTLPLGRCA